MIHRYLEILQRAQTGEKIDKTAWDQDKVMMTVIDLVERFDLSWDREVIIPTDNANLRPTLLEEMLHLYLQDGGSISGHISNVEDFIVALGLEEKHG